MHSIKSYIYHVNSKNKKLNATAPQRITINHQKLTSGENFSILPPVFINGAYSTSDSIKAAAGQCTRSAAAKAGDKNFKKRKKVSPTIHISMSIQTSIQERKKERKNRKKKSYHHQ